jgi:hypothetical protein
MPKFLVIYTASVDVMEKMENSSPEEQQKGMEAWMEWAGKCGGNLIDMGTPLGGGQVVLEDGSTSSTSNIVGYSMLQADDMEAAKELLKGHPHLGWSDGCEIEVHESLPLPT